MVSAEGQLSIRPYQLFSKEKNNNNAFFIEAQPSLPLCQSLFFRNNSAKSSVV
jgi:hypothetical protein